MKFPGTFAVRSGVNRANIIGLFVDESTFVYQGWVDAHATRRTARIRSKREPQYSDGLLCTPEQWAVAGTEPSQPVTAGVPKAAGPVVVERMEGPHLAIDIGLEARLLNAPAGAPVHA